MHGNVYWFPKTKQEKKQKLTDLGDQVAFSGSDPVVFEVEPPLLFNPSPQNYFYLRDVDDYGVRVLNTANTIGPSDIDEGISGLIIFIVRMFKRCFLYVYM